MKKLYTIALSALLAFGATATELELTAPQVRAKGFKNVTTVLAPAQTAMPTVKARKAAPMLAPTRVPESAIADKNYQLEGYGRLFGEQMTGLEILGVTEIAKEGAQLKYGPFLFNGVYFNCSYDPATMSLTIPAGQSVDYVEDGETYHLTLYNYNFADGQAHDVVFQYYPEERLFFYEAGVDAESYYTDCMVLANADAEVGYGVYGQLFVTYNTMVNSVMATTEVTEAGELGETTYYNIYVEQKGTKITIDNMLDWGFAAHPEFTFDPEAHTLSANKPVLFTDAEGSISLMGVTDDGYAQDEVVFERNSTVQDAHIFQAAAVVLTDGTNMAPYYLPQIAIPFDPYAGAGVQGVAVDNANAPVEYFNLQGVRVANPENGLYIRRQGSKVEKIIIR